MKLRELIARLLEIEGENGDLDVVIFDSTVSGDWNPPQQVLVEEDEKEVWVTITCERDPAS